MNHVNLTGRAKHLGLCCATLSLLAAILSGCGGSNLPPVPTPEPVTISVACADANAAYYQEKIAEFNEQYPNITVELRPYGPAWQGAVTADDADVLTGGEDVLADLYAQGSLFDLQAMIETEQSFAREDFYSDALALFSGRGTTWAIPAGLDTIAMYYNQDLFDQYGIPYPTSGWTLDDFLNTAIALRDSAAGVYGYATTGSTTEPDYWDAWFFVNQHGGDILDDPSEPTRTTFDNPRVVTGLEWYTRLYLDYDVAPTPEEARRLFQGWPAQYAFYRGIYLGRVAMWPLPFSQREGLYWGPGNEWQIRWGMAAMPQNVTMPEEARRLSQGWVWGEGYAISAQAPHPEACWRWIVFLSREIPYRLIPARKSLLESDEYEELVGGDLAAVARTSIEQADLARMSPEAQATFNEIGIGSLWGEAVNSVVTGEATPQEVLDTAQQEAESRLGQ